MMERINIDNYEAYFLDYVEGNLSHQQIADLKAFVDKHPELNAELEDFEVIRLEEDSMHQSRFDKRPLIREESTALLDSDYLMIAQIEGTISDEEKKRLSDLMASDPNAFEDLAIYHKTKLPQEKILFPAKASLLQKEPLKVAWWQYAAAAVLLALVTFNWNTSDKMYEPNEFSLRLEQPAEEEEVRYAYVAKKEDDHRQKEGVNRGLPPNQKKVAVNKIIQPLATPIGNDLTNEKPFIAEATPSQEQTSAEKKELVELGEAVEAQIPKENVEEVYASNEEYIPIGTFAKEKIQEKLGKGKSLSDGIISDIKEKAKKRYNITTETDLNGKTQLLSFNIGKIGFSRNKKAL